MNKNDFEINDSKNILTDLHKFYSELFSKKVTKSEQECSDFLDTINIPSISEDHKILCDKILSIDDLSTSLKNMNSGKSPCNHGLTVDFYKFFLFESYKYSKTVNGKRTFLFPKTSYNQAY